MTEQQQRDARARLDAACDPNLQVIPPAEDEPVEADWEIFAVWSPYDLRLALDALDRVRALHGAITSHDIRAALDGPDKEQP